MRLFWTAPLAVLTFVLVARVDALTPTPTPNAVNVTPGAAGVTASTHDGNVPANVVDNNLGTRWSAGGDGQWIQLSLGSSVWLRSVSIAVYRGNERKNRFDILSSTDGTTWTPLLTSVQSSGTTTAQETYNLPYQLASRLRYRGHGHVTNAGVSSTMNSVTEIDVVAATNQPSGPPPTPTGVQAFPDAGRVTLRWMHSGGGGYRVYRSADQCDTFALVGTASPSFDQSVTFSDTAVVDGRRYYYAVSAFNAAGESARTEPIAATPQLQRPSGPILSATAGPVDSGSVALQWTLPSTSSAATRYTIRRAPRPSCYPVGFPTWSDLAVVDAPAQSFTDTSAALDKPYLYAVVAENGAGVGPLSNIVAATAASSAPPSTPTPRPCPTATATPTPPPVTATPLPPNPVTVEEASGRVRIAWTRTGTVEQRAFTYSVYRAESACGPYQQVARYLTGTDLVDSDLTDGTTYYYVVAGVNPRGESLDSEVVGATPGNVPPKAPTGLTATVQEGPFVRLSWGEVFADTYSVRRGTTAGGPYAVVASGLLAGRGTTFTWDDTTVAGGTQYYYVATAVSGTLESPRSNEATAFVPGPLPAPVLRVQAGLNQLNLLWNAVPGATSYRVRSAEVSCGPWNDVATAQTNGYAYVTTSPLRRYFTVSALASGQESPASNTAAGAAILSLAGPTVTATAGVDRINLSWNAVAGATGYKILRAREQYQCYGGQPPYEVLATTAGTFYADQAVTPATRYYYRVTALYAGGESGTGSAGARVPGVLLGPTPTPMSCPTPTPTSSPTPTPLPGVVPAMPQNVSLSAGNQKTTLTWDVSSQASGYSVYRATESCGPYEVAARAVRPPFVDVGRSNGTRYFYRVAASNQNGEGPESEESSAMPVNGPPDAVTRLTGLSPSPHPRFQWQPSYSADTYRIARGNAAGQPLTDIGLVAADSFVDRTASPGIPYVYSVIAQNLFGSSPAMLVGGTGRQAPPPPAALSATTIANGIALQWSGSEGATQYRTYRSTDPEAWFAPMATVPTRSWVDTSPLTPNVRYYYVVTALSDAASEPSLMASAMAPGSSEVEVTPPAAAVTASTHDGNLPGNTVDGSLATRWAGYGGGAWMRFDLGTTRTVSSVKVAVYRGNTRSNSFYIQTSTDNATWFTRWSGSSSGTTTALETYDITDAPARYVRYFGNGNANSTGADPAWNSVTEVEIFAVP